MTPQFSIHIVSALFDKLFKSLLNCTVVYNIRRVTTVVNALAIFGDIRRYLALFGDIWRYLAIFGDIWRYLAIFGSWCLKLSYMAPEGPGRST